LCAGLLLSSLVPAAVAQTTRAQTTQAPTPAAPPLGQSHLWLKGGWSQAYGHGADDWGLGREGWLSLEGFWAARGKNWYGGLELGRMAKDVSTNDQGETIDDLEYWWLEINTKRAFGLQHGMIVDVGFGGSLLYVDGQEHLLNDPGTEPLADLGFGLQGFADFTWRRQHLLLGLGLKYAWTYDLVDVGYTNLRLGGAIGFSF
jgi:hypothetical protein